MLDSKRSVKTVSAAEAGSANPAPGTDNSGAAAAGAGGAAPMSGSVFDKLELAKRLASKINLKSNNFDGRSDFFVDLFSDTRSFSPPTFFPKKNFPNDKTKLLH